jgi:4-amino-4-deoxy-L-arabinose transferase-like glycosyltransferase
MRVLLTKKLHLPDLVVMLAITGWGLLALAPDLAHGSIWAFDESFHQVVARHVHDNPFTPMLYVDPVHDSTDTYWGSRVWLIKPPGAFWLAALLMNFVGKVPLAFRLVGLLSQLFASLTIYALARTAAPRPWAFCASVGYLSLPLGWVFTQARFVGDEIDLLLTGCICAAMGCLFVAVRRDSLWWAALAGAATGAGFLVKTVLALTPIGVAGCLWLLSLVRFCRGPRLKALVVLVVAAIVVAAPWNVYAATKWPALYRAAHSDVLVHLLPGEASAKAPQWRRPVDAVFYEVNQASYEPMPGALILLVGVWLVVRAIRRREVVVVGTALWLWATWLGHSMAAIKMHSHLWNSVVAGFVGVAIVLDDLWSSPPLAFGVGAGVAIPALLARFPALGRLRELVPAVFAQTRANPGLAEGVCVIAVGGALGWVVDQVCAKVGRPFPRWLAGGLAAGALCWLMCWTGRGRQAELAREARAENDTVYSREVGRAIEALTPKQSLVLLDIDSNPPGQLENHNLMFWSNRLVHGGRDAQDYPRAGFHPYLVSPAAEPYAALAVPAHAWLRAYDLSVPAPGPQPLPAGVRPVDVALGTLRVLGFASGPSGGKSDHYAFYLRAEGGSPQPLTVTFKVNQERQSKVVPPEASLRSRARLAQVEWFVLPVSGPPIADVQEIEFGPEPGQRIVLRP